MSIRIWFLIQQFMLRQNLPEYNHIPSVRNFYCRHCATQVATLHANTQTLPILSRLRIAVVDDERHYRVIDGMTVAEIFCVRCRNLLGWKIIAVSQPSSVYSVGEFVMRLNTFISNNNVTSSDLLVGGNNDQDGGADEEQDHDQNGGANEQNADQDRWRR
ncbi:protein yippee-like At3g08990 [Solanum lycopersicum]|uniref:protein yippee-like At3g08990 n=1 Tax=Solanum lycopersicum TaxID=4081 RepID=UPI0002766D58|nr:protein yippee-like At3g08990 [Solanum lycopersicum]